MVMTQDCTLYQFMEPGNCKIDTRICGSRITTFRKDDWIDYVNNNQEMQQRLDWLDQLLFVMHLSYITGPITGFMYTFTRILIIVFAHSFIASFVIWVIKKCNFINFSSSISFGQIWRINLLMSCYHVDLFTIFSIALSLENHIICLLLRCLVVTMNFK